MDFGGSSRSNDASTLPRLTAGEGLLLGQRARGFWFLPRRGTNTMSKQICVYAEHATLAGRVYTGDDTESDEVHCFERESIEDIAAMAAEWAARQGSANAYQIRCGRSILDAIVDCDESVALGIISDLELCLGAADLAWCRLAMFLAEGDTLAPSAMRRLSSDPRQHTYMSLRSALLMLGCTEEDGGAA